MTAAKTGWGGEFHLDATNGAGTPTELVEVVSITLPNGETERVEATHLKSPNRRREYIAGMIDDGEMEVVINYVPGSATDLLVRTAQTDGLDRNWMAVIPRTTTDWEITGTGIVTGYDRGTIEVDGVMRATITIAVSGSQTENS
jgi:predicted secreted protein